jgi:hypothetical protein
MPISSVVKNFRDGTILINDGTTPTPLALTVQYENGDFSLSGSNYSSTGSVDHTKYLDRGELASVRRTSRTFPTGSFSAMLTDISDASNNTLWDAVNRSGSFAAAVSTLGANADLYTLKITLTIEGTNFGDAADHVLIMNDCRCSIDVAEGDPDSVTLNFEVLGSITAT